MKTDSRNLSGIIIGTLLSIALFIGFSGVIILLSIHWYELGIYNYGEFIPWDIPMNILIIIILATLGTSTIYFEGRRIYRYFKNIQQGRIAKVFGLIWCIGVAFAGGVCYSISVPIFYENEFEAGPYLTWENGQDPSSAITISWKTVDLSNSTVKYGINPNNLNLDESLSTKTKYHHIRLEGLSSDTTYYYRIVGSSESDFNVNIKEFTTAPLIQKDFSFAVFSDPRTNSPTISALNQNAIQGIIASDFIKNSTELAFSICCGDIVESPHNDRSWEMWFNDIVENDFASNASLAVTTGNHERMLDSQAKKFREYFPYESLSYSFDYSNLHVIVFNTWDPAINWFGNITDEQYAWLENDLQLKSADIMNNFTILSLHPAPIKYGSLEGDWFNGRNFEKISTLAQAYGIDAVFFGHNHHYEVNLIDGTYYLNAGMGNKVQNSGVSDKDYTLDIQPESIGYYRVDVNASAMVIMSQFIDGTPMNSFIVNI